MTILVKLTCFQNMAVTLNSHKDWSRHRQKAVILEKFLTKTEIFFLSNLKGLYVICQLCDRALITLALNTFGECVGRYEATNLLLRLARLINFDTYFRLQWN
jgi:hypothetical protein